MFRNRHRHLQEQKQLANHLKMVSISSSLQRNRPLNKNIRDIGFNVQTKPYPGSKLGEGKPWSFKL